MGLSCIRLHFLNNKKVNFRFCNAIFHLIEGAARYVSINDEDKPHNVIQLAIVNVMRIQFNTSHPNT